MSDPEMPTEVDSEHGGLVDYRAAWQSLDVRQRVSLIEEATPGAQRTWRSSKYAHATARSLELRGLMRRESDEWTLTVEGRILAAWAQAQGYETYPGGIRRSPKAEAADPRRKRSVKLVDPQELAKLAGEGLHRTEIARRMEVSPSTIHRAARLHGITLPSKPRPAARTNPSRIAELASEGLHAAAIARQLGVSRAAVASAAERYGLEIPLHSPAPRPEPEPYPWPDAWTAQQCADSWGIKLSTWHAYVNQARTPDPLPGLDEQGRRRWDPESVEAAYLARPGVGRDRHGVRARVGVGGRDKIARELARRWADDDGWVTEELASALDELARAYRFKI